MTAQTHKRSLRSVGAYALLRAGSAAHVLSDRLSASDDALGLAGDRWVEWSFCMARLADGPGTTLDFGASIGFVSLAAAQRGHDVTAFDREPPSLDYVHPRVKHVQGDILDRPLADSRFDQIINCSSVEHVGLAGRYGSSDRPDGDIEAMRIMADMLAPGGRMILTIPVGLDLVWPPLHRIYGEERLPRLLEPFEVGEEQFWCKDAATGLWRQGDRAEALAVQGSDSFYALGLFVLTAR
jgi:SAM-dependent methyltransferase